jgi:uncharacterized RmlC-like cupin family protein
MNNNVLGTGEFRNVDDPAYLRFIINELFNIVADIDQVIDFTSELPEIDIERAAGAQEAKSMIMMRIRQAKHRLDELNAAAPDRRPLVVDPSSLPSILSHQGQPLTPVITRPSASTVGISSADVWMPPGHAAYAHVHLETDIIVFVRDGDAITLWWDAHGDMHELMQGPGQHLFIPRGVPHAAINIGSRPVVASEFRSNPVFDADNHRLPDLEPQITMRMPSAKTA